MTTTGFESQRPQPFTDAKLLLVEGRDDERFFSALLGHLGITGVEIRRYDGKLNLRPLLRLVPAIPGFTGLVSVGVVRDADENATDTFRSVSDALQTAGLPTPPQQLFPAGNKPQVAVLLLPPWADNGELEDLCLRSVADDPAVQCVDEYFDCLEKRLLQAPNPLSKARVHAFLASRERPDRRLGEAADAGTWPWGSPAFDEVKQFLRML